MYVPILYPIRTARCSRTPYQHHEYSVAQNRPSDRSSVVATQSFTASSEEDGRLTGSIFGRAIGKKISMFIILARGRSRYCGEGGRITRCQEGSGGLCCDSMWAVRWVSLFRMSRMVPEFHSLLVCVQVRCRSIITSLLSGRVGDLEESTSTPHVCTHRPASRPPTLEDSRMTTQGSSSPDIPRVCFTTHLSWIRT